MMTNQEIFDKVWDHFITHEGPRSVDEYGMCSYRGYYGARCAIGILIPDELYTDEIEGKNAEGLTPALDRYLGMTKEDGEWDGVRSQLLLSLQDAHDRNPKNYPEHVWREGLLVKLTEVALQYGLQVNA